MSVEETAVDRLVAVYSFDILVSMVIAFFTVEVAMYSLYLNLRTANLALSSITESLSKHW